MLSKIIRFILRPFAKPIRYGALKIMKKLRAPNDGRPAIAASDHILNEVVLPSVFNILEESKFRELARFDKLPISEHDRIFNELEVAGVCVAMFNLRAVKSLVKPDDYHFWQDVEKHLPKQLQRILLSYRVDGSNAKLMKQLIDMRYAEYEKLSEKVWDANNSNKADFDSMPPEVKDIAAAVQAIAVGTNDHIRQGKIQDNDPLVQHLISWLLLLQRKIGKFVRNL